MSLSHKIQEATEILIKAKEAAPNKALILFSGGKDSIVAADLAKKTLGISNAFSEVSLLPQSISTEISKIGAMMGLIVHQNNELPYYEFDKHWLNQVPPTKWKPSDLDKVRHWKSIPRYAKANNYDLMIFGRRLEENTIPSPFYLKKSLNIHQVHPIYNWTRDEVFQYLHQKGLDYPSCYKDGSKHLYSIVSLGQQAYKQSGDINDVFDIWYRLGRNYLRRAASLDDRVRIYMEERGFA